MDKGIAMGSGTMVRRAVTGMAAVSLVGTGLVALPSPAHAAVVTTATCSGTADFAGGAGTSPSPFQVVTYQQLYNATACATGVYVSLMNEIDLTGVTNWDASAPVFYGDFNGNNRTIRNLTTSNASGLFGFAETTSVIHDLNLVNFDISSSVSDKTMGPLASSTVGRIERVTVDSTSSVTSTGGGTWSVTGGLVGQLDGAGTGIVTGSTSGAVVSGSTRVGGLAGWMVNGGITDSSFTGNVTATSGEVSGQANTTHAGGAVGQLDAGTITNTTATTTVSGEGYGVGGLVGIMYGGAITGSSANATVTSTWLYAGGLVGEMDSGSITSSHSSGSVTGSNGTGGLVGYSASTIDMSYSTSAVTGRNNSSDIGGLVGQQAAGAITKSFATGVVTSTTAIPGSYKTNLGGLVGSQSTGSITDSFASGAVDGRERVGGLVGRQGGSITTSYATGSVTGTSLTGGLVGDSPGTTTHSFWDLQTTGQASSGSGVAKTTAQMKTFSTFDDATWSIYNGWEATSTKTWGICEASGYPFLRWYQTTDPNCPAPTPPAPAPTPGGGGGGSSSTSTDTPTPTPTTPPTTVTPPAPSPLGPQESAPVTGLRPGGAFVTTGGEQTPVSTTPNGPGGTVTSTADGWSVAVGGRTPAGKPQPLGAGGAVQVPRGGGVQVTGTGYEPGSTVLIYAMNPALLLGTVTVGVDGAFDETVAFPAAITPGDAILQLNGFSTAGTVRSYSLGVRVVKDGTVKTRTVKTTVYFGPGSSRLDAKDRATLARLVRSIPKGASSVSVVSTGYVQGTSDTSNDVTLSTQRAAKVVAQLKADGLAGKYYVTGRGVAKEPGAMGRKVIVTVTYPAK